MLYLWDYVTLPLINRPDIVPSSFRDSHECPGASGEEMVWMLVKLSSNVWITFANLLSNGSLGLTLADSLINQLICSKTDRSP